MRERGEWEFGGYYLARPHADRGGSWYACSHTAGERSVRRRSLRTTSFEEAKKKLVALVEAAPAVAAEVPHPRDVAAIHVMTAYLDGHGSQIRTVEYAERAGELVATYLLERKTPLAPVSDWTPSRQLDFAKWCVAKHKHKASTIERTFNVIGAAFKDAARVKTRVDPMGREIEGALISHAPGMEYKAARIAKELRLADQAPAKFVPTLDEMAKFIDAVNAPHARRWMLLALATWARPEAIYELEESQWDRRTNTLDLNPKGRPQTNKRRPIIAVCMTLKETLPRGSTSGAASPSAFISIKGERVANIKKLMQRVAKSTGLPITQRTFRTFMATTCRGLCSHVPREKRSVWLGHSVLEGSRTTDHYEVLDPEYLRDVALATDFILCELQKRCSTRLFAVDVQLKREELRRIGAKESALKGLK